MMNFDIQAFARSICADKRTLEMFRTLVNYAYVRVVNYHNTGWHDARRFENELAYFSQHFSPVTPEDLDVFLADKKWTKPKPGLILGFYDGLRSQYDTLFPLLERYRMTGWFFLPAFFPDVPVGEQHKYAEAHQLLARDGREHPDGRVALSWDEVRKLAEHHVICCHTGSHCRITRQSTDEEMRREIVDAKRRIEAQIGRRVRVFSWRGGEEYLYNLKAHKYFEEAEYSYVASDLKIEKIH